MPCLAAQTKMSVKHIATALTGSSYMYDLIKGCFVVGLHIYWAKFD